MIAEVINNPKAGRYLKRFSPGLFVFRENDDSQDLYLLVSGELEVLKGSRVITKISEPGTLFGEMSFLLGGQRTASVRASQETETIQVAREQISAFMGEFPEASLEMARSLARRLDKTTRVSYGLSEFCDHLPDAVLLTDEDGKVLTWNRSAEDLYNIEALAPSARSVGHIYEDPDAYRKFIEGVSAQSPVREKVLAVGQSDGKTRFVSTSLTLLYDGHHNFQGALSLGRDVTSFQRIEAKYRVTRRWVIPCLALVALLAAAIFYGYPYYQRGQRIVREDPSGLHTLLVKDFLLLKSLLAGQFSGRRSTSMSERLGEFLSVQSETRPPYTGLVLLDKNKQVIDAVSLETGASQTELVGSTYGGIDFHGPAESLHRVLILYRTDKRQPMGTRGLELAFALSSGDRFLGWVVFQMDEKALQETYSVTVQDLQKMVFKGP